MKKVLFCASVDFHFATFHLPYMKWFQEQGWEVHVAAKGNIELPYCDRKFDLPVERSPYKLCNIKAYRILKNIIDDNQYNIIHCHTPMGGVLARLATRMAHNKGAKVLYTAHGFHFCKGAPLASWLVYYPIEKWLAHYTDHLITINLEDYNLAQKRGFKAGSIVHVHGVGVDTEKFQPILTDEKIRLRAKHGYNAEDFILFYAAELNKNKNQELLIKTIRELKSSIPNIKLLLAGEGPMHSIYMKLSFELNVSEEVDFLGYRNDVDELLKMSDVIVASSLREGLPVGVMEALACGKPVVASENRGHKELIENGKNGFIVKRNNIDIFANRIFNLFQNSELYSQMADNAILKIKPYILANVKCEMASIYNCSSGGEKWNA